MQLSLFAQTAGNITAIEEFEDSNAASMYRIVTVIKYCCIGLEVLLGVCGTLIGLSMSKFLADMLNAGIF